ncbi:hypothetical protein [Elizabethkingia anophelis]|uniref:hypothetical protein n=1 Tax=Elizabethkingia anophelis TaxID=1117645 RepID=UPI0024E209C2|nr:hypothetical protein [Elizabethkingia anophelis]CAH1149649.1 hypothetical protein EAVVTKC53_03015 [Elizabethkingia anophelis]CAI9678936.1 hypothetical protein EAVVTKC53_00828 [Elizabethkingia anophelis]
MIRYIDAINKQGIALDFIIYTVASMAPKMDDTIHGFFFQKYIRRNDIPKHVSIDDIKNTVSLVTSTEDFTDKEKKEILNQAISSRLAYYHKDIGMTKVENADFFEDYFEYIDSFIDITEYIESKEEIDFYEIEFIEDVYNNDEINEITECIIFFLSQYEEYNEETEEWEIINKNDQKISRETLNDFFEEYISLRSIFTFPFFISYYASLFHFLNAQQVDKLEYFTREVYANLNSPVINDVASNTKYLENLIKENENLLFKYSFDIPQLDGYLHKGTVFSNVYYSSWNYLNMLNGSGFLNYSGIGEINLYPYREIESEHSLYGVKLRFLNWLLYDKKEEENNDLDKEFSSLVDKKYRFINYLKNKNFNSDEIRTIVNLLSENKYNQLDIKHINLSRDIYFFRFCYFFFIFDYFEEIEGKEFNSIASFEDIVKFNPHNKRENKQQYHKNYISINNPDSKDYPFSEKKINSFLSEIEYSLGISREKLKEIS